MEYYDLKTYFFLFIIYSFLGWIVEIVNELISNKRLVNRGFFIGPYCPIYGFGAVMVLIFLKDYTSHPVFLFINAIVICCFVEYFTSYLMEKILHARWWDYSNRKFNINGRICLETMIPFGIAVLVGWYLINPFLLKLIKLLPNTVITIILCTFTIIFLIDCLISFNVVAGYKKAIKKISTNDITVDFNKYVKEELSKSSYLKRRLIEAFPKIDLKEIGSKINEKLNR